MCVTDSLRRDSIKWDTCPGMIVSANKMRRWEGMLGGWVGVIFGGKVESFTIGLGAEC